ncbi:MAG: cytochrome c3 family protein [Planctomycetota bacterium]
MKKGLFVTAILCWVVLLVGDAVDTSAKLLGDESDGSRAAPVHLLELFAEPLFEDEQSQQIAPDDEPLLPFSTRRTCSECHIQPHNYEIISKGWHFNAVEPNIPPGRVGQPWIYVDTETGTQIPLSYRRWLGAFRPEQVGVTTWQFTLRFGRQTPGGGPGEIESDDPGEIMRSLVSGKLEINCLTCHNAHPGQDQAEYATQVALQNFRWAAAGACEFASIKGMAVEQSETYDFSMSDDIAVTYRENTFDHKNRVLFDIVRKVPNERCYFCHSNKVLAEDNSEKWATDEDVHLAAGLTCVDCHRNGLGHNITRGYEDEPQISANPPTAALSCRGCHIAAESSSTPIGGRLGAPVAEHLGIPTVHFDRLTCTACHSGPWPGPGTYRVKTSRAHGLGTHNVNKSSDALPHIITPVFAEQRPYYSHFLGQLVLRMSDRKIGPHNLIWPAFWAGLKDEKVTPIDITVARETVGKIIAKAKPATFGDWPSLTAEHITKALTLLSSRGIVEGTPVYICGGKLYRLDDSDPNQLSETEHSAAQPYLWPIAHNVRPAAQSLGVRNCQDCHSTKESFFFGKVAVDTPIVSERDSVKEMLEFQDVPAFYTKAFAMSFVFRPMLKIVALLSCAVLAAVLLLYALKALECIAKIVVDKD